MVNKDYQKATDEQGVDKQIQSQNHGLRVTMRKPWF